jgi:hypothetical protein
MKKLAIILGLCLVLLLTTVGCGGNQSSATANTRVVVSALTALADSHITSYVNSLQALAVTPEVQSADWPQMANLLAKVANNGNAAIVWFALPDGSYYAVGQGKVSQNISDRDYFPKLMAGNTVMGSLVVSGSTGKKSAVVAVPVMKDGKVIGGLGISIFLENLSQTLSQELGPAGSRTFYALDGTGAVALSSDTSQIMAQNADLTKNVEWQTSLLTGWRFALGYLAGGSSPSNLESERQTAVAVVHSSAVGLGTVLKNYQSETDRITFLRAYIDPIRFYTDQTGYFYIYDFDCVNIAHATQKDLQGQNLYNYQDSKGNFVIRELAAAAKNGGGFVEYYWVNPSSTSAGEQRKVGYVEPILGTNYFIGTGVYTGN